MNINPLQLTLHFTILLGIFIGINLLCNKVIIPDLQAQWLEAEKALKEESIQSFSSTQNLIAHVYEQQIHRKNVQKILSKTDAYSFAVKFIEPQFRAIAEQTMAELTTAVYQSPVKETTNAPDGLQNTKLPGEETSESNIQIALINPDEFNRQLISRINQSLNIWDFLGFKIFYYQEKLPGLMETQSDFISSVEIQAGKQKLVVALTWQPTILEQNLLPTDLDVSAFAYKTGSDKLWNIQRNEPIPLPKGFNTDLYQTPKGLIETTRDGKKFIHTWVWKELANGPTLLLIDIPDTRTFNEAEHDFSWVNILTLITFLIICICWFYFMHNFKSNLENQEDLEIKQMQLTNQLKQLEIMLSSEGQKETPVSTKKEFPLEEQKQTYFIPQEQRYIDQKFDYQKEEYDVLMDGCKSNLLKQLLQRIRKGE